MPPARRGSIVWVELLDPQGRNPKRRPAVIVSDDEEIQASGEAWVVAVSTQLNEAPREVQVDLPWHANRHACTGLTERCSAVCTWLERVKVSEILTHIGMVPTAQMLAILNLVESRFPPEQDGGSEADPP